MISFFDDQHALHAPTHEIFRGERVPCFESPSRAEVVRQQLAARGHSLRAPGVNSGAVLAQVHTARYLAFLASAWAQWPGWACPRPSCSRAAMPRPSWA